MCVNSTRCSCFNAALSTTHLVSSGVVDALCSGLCAVHEECRLCIGRCCHAGSICVLANARERPHRLSRVLSGSACVLCVFVSVCVCACVRARVSDMRRYCVSDLQKCFSICFRRARTPGYAACSSFNDPA